MIGFDLAAYRSTQIDEKWLDVCYQKKWFKLFVPTDYGGLQLSMAEGCKRLMEIAAVNAGLGWVVNLGAGANWFAGSFSDTTAATIFTPEKTVIAGSGYANGTWRKEGAHFCVNGKWSKCTGAAHATHFSLPAKNTDGEEVIFLLQREQVAAFSQDWEIMGLKNTSSFEVEVNAALVPETLVFEIGKIKNHRDYAVFHLPFDLFARLCMSATFIGGVHCLANTCLATSVKPTTKQLLNDVLLHRLYTSEEAFLAAVKHVENCTQEEQNNLDFQTALYNKLGEQNLELFHMVNQLFLTEGLQFVDENSLIHWAYKDVLVMLSHYMTKPVHG